MFLCRAVKIFPYSKIETDTSICRLRTKSPLVRLDKYSLLKLCEKTLVQGVNENNWKAKHSGQLARSIKYTAKAFDRGMRQRFKGATNEVLRTVFCNTTHVLFKENGIALQFRI